MVASPVRVRMQPPPRLRVYVWIVVAVADAALVASLRFAPRPTLWQLAVAVLLAAMVGVAHAFPIQIAPRLRVSADSAPAFAAALLLPPYLAVAVSVIGIAAGEIARRPVLIQASYNVAVATLRAAAGAAVFTALAPAPLAGEPNPWRVAPAFAAAALAMYLTNTILIDAVVAVQRKLNPWRGWLGRRRAQLPHEASLYLLGVLVAVIGARWPAALVLLAVPSVIVYRSLRDGVAARMQTRHALEELADTLDRRDEYTTDHSRKVADIARAVALRLGVPADEAEMIYLAARVHDVGKIGIKSSILTKTGPLTTAEWSAIRTHPEAGARILARFPDYVAGCAVVQAHHERWDGRGYPSGLRGTAIPLGARVIAAADAFDAMTSRRPYRPALAPDIVRAELRGGRGTQFDPRVVDTLLELLEGYPEFASGRGTVPGQASRQPA